MHLNAGFHLTNSIFVSHHVFINEVRLNAVTVTNRPLLMECVKTTQITTIFGTYCWIWLLFAMLNHYLVIHRPWNFYLISGKKNQVDYALVYSLIWLQIRRLNEVKNLHLFDGKSRLYCYTLKVLGLHKNIIMENWWN